MSSNIINQMPYLRTSRAFPEDLHQISIEMNKAYLDIANSVNSRVIGIFPTRNPAINGTSWYFDNNKKQQGLRQFFTFNSTASIPHNISFKNISRFSNCYGAYTDGTNWYGIIYGTNTAITGNLSFYLTPTDIVFVSTGGTPALVTGNIVIEWISDV